MNALSKLARHQKVYIWKLERHDPQGEMKTIQVMCSETEYMNASMELERHYLERIVEEMIQGDRDETKIHCDERHGRWDTQDS